MGASTQPNEGGRVLGILKECSVTQTHYVAHNNNSSLLYPTFKLSRVFLGTQPLNAKKTQMWQNILLEFC